MKQLISSIIADLSPTPLMADAIHCDGKSIIAGTTSISLADVDHIFPLGLGKAAVAQTEALQLCIKQYPQLKQRLLKGMILTKDGHHGSSDDYTCLSSAHPLLDQRGLDNSKQLIETLKNLPERSLVLVCLSGGASALVELPASDLNLSTLQEITHYLLNSGASIEEINAIRQVLSQVKNGGLAALTSARFIEVFVISDVSSNDLRFIGSGPFYHIPLDLAPMRELVKNSFPSALASTILQRIDSPSFIAQEEKKREMLQQKQIHHHMSLDWKTLFTVAEKNCRLLYPDQCVFTASYPHQGNFSLGIKWHLNALTELFSKNQSFTLISGGELPVTVNGKGKGGRNTHFALTMAHELFDKNILELAPYQLASLEITSLATDGSDGPTDCAGAELNFAQWQKSKHLKLNAEDYLKRCDSYHFFEQIGALIKTGPTGNNVMDLRLIRFILP